MQRSVLENELTRIRGNIIKLTSLVNTAIEKAMTALYERNVELAQGVIAADEEINLLRYDLEQDCLRVLATQQPAAIDLRTVVTAMHLAVELERIGDHAAGIARLVERMEDEDEIESLHKLPKMAKRARSMIRQGIDAFVQNDAGPAYDLIRKDDKIDKQYSRLFRETLQEMRDDTYIRRATFLLWVGHNLERIGDRATNIAERVIFMATGEFVEITPDLMEQPFDNGRATA
ncbi:MAG: phosphate signaling complex protein PhoU [Anaerolineae bacterium]